MDPAEVDAAAAKLNGKQLEASAGNGKHRRWAAVKWMTGWTLGPRHDPSKRHPNLVSYQELDEPTKQYDRDQIFGNGQHVASPVGIQQK